MRLPGFLATLALCAAIASAQTGTVTLRVYDETSGTLGLYYGNDAMDVKIAPHTQAIAPISVDLSQNKAISVLRMA